jgi:hypothetical protein
MGMQVRVKKVHSRWFNTLGTVDWDLVRANCQPLTMTEIMEIVSGVRRAPMSDCLA